MIHWLRYFRMYAVIWFLGCGFLFPSAAYAEEEPQGTVQDSLPEASLPDLVREVLDRNPEILAVRAEWQAREKKIIQSWALPDPMAGMDMMGKMKETRVGPEENRFMASQQIPFPLKLWEKRKAAQAESEAAKQRYLAARRDVLNRLKKAYYELYETDASLEVIDEIHGLLKKFESVASARYSSRQGSQRDVAKAQAEVSLTLEQVYLLEQKRETLAALINSLLNRSVLDALGKAKQPERIEFKKTLVELVTLASRNRQEIKEREAWVNKRKHEKKLARMEWIPDLNASFSYTWVGSGMTTDPEDGKNNWMFPLTVNVPIWQNRLVPALAEAKKELEAARAELAASKNETYYEVKDAYVRYQTASKISGLYDAAVIPQANLALTSDQAGYESGQTDFLNLLDSERIYLNAKLTYIKIYAEALRSYADLERAAGLDLAEG